jgi:uncharacterized protein YdeI (YjbR/CyaY-like superfamily)
MPQFFETPAASRRWLARNHGRVPELWVGFHKKATGRPSMTYHEALDEALCVGWIDGIRKRVDGDSYTVRFTPRRRGSIWSQVNIKRVNALERLGRMTPAGRAVFEARDERKTRQYSFERDTAVLGPALEGRFRQHAAAWAFFSAQPPGYRKLAAWFVVSAKKDETRRKRLEVLIAASASSRRLL